MVFYAIVLALFALGCLGSMFYFESRGYILKAEVSGYVAGLASLAALYALGLVRYMPTGN